MTIRVAIVEDDPVTREGQKSMVNLSDDLHCSDTFANSESFLASFKHLDVDVVLMDINLSGKSGIECVEQCKIKRPEVQFLMCTVLDDWDMISDALNVGATGYLLKGTDALKLIEAIKEIHNGGSPISPKVARKITNSFRGKEKDEQLFNLLTPRQKEVLNLLEKGYTYSKIATKLSIKLETVRSYIRKMYEKLGVHNRTDAVNKIRRKK